MTIFKRISSTLVSRVDQMVSQLENHDAVIDAAIREARQNAAKAKVRLGRVHVDGARMREKLAELQVSEKKWAERARNIATEDETKALECLRRRRECQTHIKQLGRALTQHEELEARLNRDVQAAEVRINEMQQQRNLMRTRQSAADALTSINPCDVTTTSDIADAFERWEIQITEAELEAGSVEMADHLERGFIDTEEQNDLRAELHELLNGEEKQ